MDTDGFEFVEFAAPDPRILERDFQQMGFIPTAVHRTKKITLYQQGDINFIINAEPDSQAAQFAKQHGAGACAMGFRVKNADKAFKQVLELGAQPFEQKIGHGELKIPAIHGIGGTVIYLIDRYGKNTIYQHDFKPLPTITNSYSPCGLTYIDHLTHNVQRGQMDFWADFYIRLFNFRQIRYFDIQGQKTGLMSRALASPCGKIKIPLNEAKDDKSQIEEFLHEFHGEGIQHIALGTDQIYDSVEALQKNGLKFLAVPDTYYEVIEQRVPDHQEDLARMTKDRILIDGAPQKNEGLLLQIFTENMLGPVFFEIIQRKGNEGFGEGNFQALFEAIERDQIKRGVL